MVLGSTAEPTRVSQATTTGHSADPNVFRTPIREEQISQSDIPAPQSIAKNKNSAESNTLSFSSGFRDNTSKVLEFDENAVEQPPDGSNISRKSKGSIQEPKDPNRLSDGAYDNEYNRSLIQTLVKIPLTNQGKTLREFISKSLSMPNVLKYHLDEFTASWQDIVLENSTMDLLPRLKEVLHADQTVIRAFFKSPIIRKVFQDSHVWRTFLQDNSNIWNQDKTSAIVHPRFDEFFDHLMAEKSWELTASDPVKLAQYFQRDTFLPVIQTFIATQHAQPTTVFSDCTPIKVEKSEDSNGLKPNNLFSPYLESNTKVVTALMGNPEVNGPKVDLVQSARVVLLIDPEKQKDPLEKFLKATSLKFPENFAMNLYQFMNY